MQKLPFAVSESNLMLCSWHDGPTFAGLISIPMSKQMVWHGMVRYWRPGTKDDWMAFLIDIHKFLSIFYRLSFVVSIPGWICSFSFWNWSLFFRKFNSVNGRPLSHFYFILSDVDVICEAQWIDIKNYRLRIFALLMKLELETHCIHVQRVLSIFLSSSSIFIINNWNEMHAKTFRAPIFHQ